MDELKMLTDMVAHLPQMALWVLAGFWAYKVVVVGSIYGLIRFVVDKTHSWLTTPKLLNGRIALEGEAISGAMDSLVAQVRRIRGRSSGSSLFVHGTDVDWLRDAINDKIAKDEAAKRA